MQPDIKSFEKVTTSGPPGLSHHLPKSAEAIAAFHRNLEEQVAGRAPGTLPVCSSPAVRALSALIASRPVIRMYVEEMLVQVRALPGAPGSTVDTVGELLAALDTITTLAPVYDADKAKRNAFPMSTLFAYMMMTPAGEALFRGSAFNDALQGILKEWCAYLNSAASTHVLNETPSGWLCAAAFDEFKLGDFVIDRTRAHWGFTSYNDFFHRQILAERRPVAAPDNPKVIVSANDGNIVSIARGVKRVDSFWLKGEPFSLVDMLNRSEHVDRFVGGDVFQSFLSGGNYHRWHSPISGVVRQVSVVDGLTFSDAESAGWDPEAVLSEGYYSCVNTRGLICIESDEPSIGLVCVIPTGITEISSVTNTVRTGQYVKKGQEIGHFSYGGSSLCLVFQPGAIDEYTVPPPPSKPVRDPSSGPPIQVNAQIAIAR